jgi:predicted ABC-type transport system involved in lysophospholipase L1 biosynthesis ATPase subunit
MYEPPKLSGGNQQPLDLAAPDALHIPARVDVFQNKPTGGL